jgi:hypothetical protein
VPVLQFNGDFIVEFVKKLAQTVPGVTTQLRAVVGGSMGGNLSLRLGRPRADARLHHGRRRLVARRHVGIEVGQERAAHALALPWAFAGGDSRFKDETAVVAQRVLLRRLRLGGKAAFIVNITKPQAQEWYGPSYRCRDSAIRLSRIGRYETYDANFRRWHWRLAAEQLIFSHRIKENGQPLYASNAHRLLLMCGVDDTGGDLCEATRQVAVDMKYTRGHALWLRNTGHSIQDERPNFLDRHIADFIAKPHPASRWSSTSRTRPGPLERGERLTGHAATPPHERAMPRLQLRPKQVPEPAAAARYCAARTARRSTSTRSRARNGAMTANEDAGSFLSILVPSWERRTEPAALFEG